MTARISFLFILFVTTLSVPTQAQDTLRIDFQTFLSKALNNSGQVDYAKQDVELAENTVDQAKAQRILPSVEFNSQHGLVPGVKSDVPGLPEDEYYLDPNLRNDWEDWAIFTRFQLTAAQPVFTWGAINKAVDAAKLGAEAAQYSFEAKKEDLEIRLFELYYSRILAMEIERLLEEAQDKVDQIEGQIEDMQEEGDTSLDDSEIFK